MNLVSVSAIAHKSYQKTLFENVSFGIDEGEKIAVIGPNGCGKTTLLNMIAGKDRSYEGTISYNHACEVSYLSQKIDFDPENKIIDHVLSGDNAIFRLIRRYEHAVQEGRSVEMTDLTEEMDRRDAWKKESEIRSVLSALKITDYSAPLKTFSGGMLRKAELARLFCGESRLMVLDEPTNHLDLETIAWLEKALDETSRAVLFVTHDRYFLQKTASKMIELDNGRFYMYDGGYSRYLKLKEIRRETEQNRKNRTEAILKREREWLASGCKARTGKQKARIKRAGELMDQETGPKASMAEFSSVSERLGKQILELHKITKSYDETPLFKPFTYHFKKGEKLGIAGPNGCGKTTFLNIITGRDEPSGGYVKKGLHTRFGYFQQLFEVQDHDKTVIDYLKEEAEIAGLHEGIMRDIKTVLNDFLYTPDMYYMKLRNLSGGERRRLMLIRVLVTMPNFLILDEPTNDFDLLTLNLLENYLNRFNGLVLVVSHDRWFLDKTCDYLLVFENETIKGFPGSASEYLDYLKSGGSPSFSSKKLKKPDQFSKKNRSEASVRQKKKFPYKEQQEFKALEAEIEQMESRKKELEREIQDAGGDYQKLHDAARELEELNLSVENKTERWLELTESLL